jgi:hypothetical protein
MSSPRKLVLPPLRPNPFEIMSAAWDKIREIHAKRSQVRQAMLVRSELAGLANNYRSTEFVTTLQSLSRRCGLSERLIERALAGVAQAGIIDYAQLKRGPIAIRLLDVQGDRK